MRGKVERVAAGILHGWLCDETQADRAVGFDLLVNGRPVGCFTADAMRGDLIKKKIGCGAHAFKIKLLPDWLQIGKNTFAARAQGEDKPTGPTLIWNFDSALQSDMKEVVRGLLASGQKAFKAADYISSRQAFTKALQIEPGEASAARDLAKSHRSLKDFQKAADYFGRYVALKPKDAVGRHDLGNALAKVGRHEEAVKEFRAGIGIAPSRTKILSDLGRSLLELGRHQDAESAFAKAATANPTSVEGLIEWARTLMLMKKADHALQPLRKATELDPGNAAAFRELARALKADNQHAEAAKALQQSIQIEPNNAASHHDLGRVFARLQQQEDAFASYTEALRLQPTRGGILLDIGSSCAALKRFADAEQFLLRHVQSNPSDTAGWFALGRTLEAVGRFQDATVAYTEVVSVEPRHVQARRDLARLYRRLERFDEALALLSELLEEDPDNSKLLADNGHVLFAAKRYEDAISCFDRVVSSGAANTSILLDRIRALLRLKRNREAEAHLHALLEQHPDDIRALIEFGRLLNQEKRPEQAIRYFEKVLSLNDCDVSGYHGMGIAHRRIGKTADALAFFERALAISPGHVGSLLQMAELSHLEGNLDAARRFADAVVVQHDDHVPARILRAQASFEQGQTQIAMEDLEHVVSIDPGNVRAKMYRDVVSKHITGDGVIEVGLCILGDASADIPSELYTQVTRVFFCIEGRFVERKSDGETIATSGDWRNAVERCATDWILVSVEGIPTGETIRSLTARAGPKVGVVAEKADVEECVTSLWLRAPLLAWLELHRNGPADWRRICGDLSKRIRVRQLNPRPSSSLIESLPGFAVLEEKREVWLVSSSGVKLFGGVEQFLRNMAPIYVALGFTPVIVGLLESVEGQEKTGEVDGLKFVNIVRTVDEVRALALERNPVIAHGTTGIGYEIASALEGLNTAVIYGSHFWRDMFIGDGSFENVDLNGRPRLEFNRLCAIVDQGYANSRYTQTMIQRYFGVTQPIVYSLPFDRADEGHRTPGSYVLLLNGRPDKGFNLVADLAKLLPSLTFRVVAAQVSRERIEERLESAKLTNIEVVGWTADVASLYRGARVVIVPSYSFIETFSRVVIEAHRFGVPVVGSDRGNVPLLLEQSGRALPEDVDLWAAELERLYQDDEYYAERCRLARANSVRYRFSAQAPRIENLVRSSIGRVAVAVGSGIGNMIQCTPLIRRLSQTLNRRVDVIINQDFPGCGVLFANAPWVGQVIEANEHLQKYYFNIVLVLDSFGAMLPKFNADDVVVTRRNFSFDITRNMHESFFNLHCISELAGLTFQQADVDAYFVGDFERTTVIRGRIGLHAGGKAGKWMAKRWPYYEDLVLRLKAKGFDVVSFGSASEYIEGTVDLTGTDLHSTIENVALCEYFIANDSGIMHIADALGVPLTSIFGPTSVVKNGPLASTSQVIAVEKSCAPCQFDSEQLAACTCIAELSLELVERKVDMHMSRCRRSNMTEAPAEDVSPQYEFLDRRGDMRVAG